MTAPLASTGRAGLFRRCRGLFRRLALSCSCRDQSIRLCPCCRRCPLCSKRRAWPGVACSLGRAADAGRHLESAARRSGERRSGPRPVVLRFGSGGLAAQCRSGGCARGSRGMPARSGGRSGGAGGCRLHRRAPGGEPGGSDRNGRGFAAGDVRPAGNCHDRFDCAFRRWLYRCEQRGAGSFQRRCPEHWRCGHRRPRSGRHAAAEFATLAHFPRTIGPDVQAARSNDCNGIADFR